MPDIFTPSTSPSTPLAPSSTPAGVSATGPLGKLNLFSSMCLNPTGVAFENQEQDEVIHLFVRRHFITNFPWIFYTVLFSLVPVALSILLNLSGLTLFSFPPQYITFLLLFYALIVFGYAFSSFINWFYNIGIVTQKRVVDIDSINLLQQDVGTALLKKVVDATYLQRGFFQSFFNYGDVKIQTEGTEPNIDFDLCPHPGKVVDVVLDLRGAILSD